MKTRLFQIGGRTKKTVVAVWLCFLVDFMRNSNAPFYSVIAAILCIQRNWKDSIKVAANREIATILGGVWGMIVLGLERYIYLIPYELLRDLFLSCMLIPIINVSVFIKQEKGTFLMCVVFLCITVTHGSDGNPFVFGISRIADTTMGIIVALFVNRFGEWGEKCRTHILEHWYK